MLRYMNTINVVGIKMVDYFGGFTEIIDWISHSCSDI